MNKLGLINLDIIDKYCYIPEYLEISYSKIKGAGLGIFCKKKILQGTFLGNYCGKILECDKCDGSYNFSTIINNKKKIICGCDINYSNWTRYMNSSLESEDNVIVIVCKNKDIYNTINTKYICLDGYIMFYAKTDIAIGDELLFNYGEEYINKLIGI